MGYKPPLDRFSKGDIRVDISICVWTGGPRCLLICNLYLLFPIGRAFAFPRGKRSDNALVPSRSPSLVKGWIRGGKMNSFVPKIFPTKR